MLKLGEGCFNDLIKIECLVIKENASRVINSVADLGFLKGGFWSL